MARILLKLSGEALSGKTPGKVYDESILRDVALSIRGLLSGGNQIMLVIGGGNLFRGIALASQLGVERSTADYIGMLATIQNALVVRDYFLANGIDIRVASAIAMPQVCESYIPKRVARHLEKGRVIIFAAGLGAPFFTTDTSAVQRALELSATEVVFVKNGVDALYDKDPRNNPDASYIKEVTASEVMQRGLRALDLAAVALARDNDLPLRITGMNNLGDIQNRDIGSLITPK